MNKIFFYLSIMIIFFSKELFAFDNVRTHPEITKKAIENSYNLSSYLKKSLNLPEESLPLVSFEKIIMEWLMEGSYLEDEPNCRASNHFHNPIQSWDVSGVKDLPTIFCALDDEYPPRNINSAVHWATGYVDSAPDGDKVDTGNQYDWDHAREYFYTYLIATDNDVKENYLANSILALGYVMHMLQDMAVPAHVRDDFKSHLDFIGPTEYTTWYPSTSWWKNKFEYYVQNNTDLITGITKIEIPEISITKLWDTNLYTGHDPDENDSSEIGLAEFTNMNFASKNTIFSEDFLIDSETSNDVYYQPYPKKTSTNIQDLLDDNLLPISFTSEDDVVDNGIYIMKTGDGEKDYKFAHATYFTRNMDPVFGMGDEELFFKTFEIDDECIKEYAEILLPRAIGYSTALLDYFFRGKIDLRMTDDLYFDFTYNHADELTSVRLLAKNITDNEEEMSDGNIELVVKYINPNDYTEINYITVPEQNGNDYILRDEYIELEFDLTETPVPLSNTDVSLQVIFRGQLGNESDAIAVGFMNFDNIEITAPDAYVYSIIDGSISPQQFTYIKAKIKSSDKPIGNGSVIAIAKYKNRTDYQEDLSTDPPYADDREDEFSYSVSTPIEIESLNTENWIDFNFDFTDYSIPAGITDLSLQVVFKSDLDDENDVAVAIGNKDLNEPMHITVWNATDYVYLDGILRPADEIRGDAGLYAMAVEGGIYIDPYNLDNEIAFYSPDSEPVYYNATYSSLYPGTYGRLIFIPESSFNIRIHREATDPLTDNTVNFTYSGVVNQETSEGVFQNTSVTTFRGIIQHSWNAYAWYYPYSTGISTAPWPEVTDDPVAATTIIP